MIENKPALREAVMDTIIGTLINFPLNILAMWTVFTLEMTVIQSSLFLWLIFTMIAIVRKYYTRIYFEKKSKVKLTSDK